MKEVHRIIVFFSELQEGCGLLSGAACWINQSCLTFCDPVDCSPPGSSVYGISPARILEWVVIFSSRGSSRPGAQTCISQVSCSAGPFFTTEPPGRDVLISGCGLAEKDTDIRISMGRRGAGSFSLWVSRCSDPPLKCQIQCDWVLFLTTRESKKIQTIKKLNCEYLYF